MYIVCYNQEVSVKRDLVCLRKDVIMHKLYIHMYSVTPCRKEGPKHVVYRLTPYTLIKFFVFLLTNLINCDIVIAYNGDEPPKDSNSLFTQRGLTEKKGRPI